jgi:hypothetical protein
MIALFVQLVFWAALAAVAQLAVGKRGQLVGWWFARRFTSISPPPRPRLPVYTRDRFGEWQIRPTMSDEQAEAFHGAVTHTLRSVRRIARKTVLPERNDL